MEKTKAVASCVITFR